MPAAGAADAVSALESSLETVDSSASFCSSPAFPATAARLVAACESGMLSRRAFNFASLVAVIKYDKESKSKPIPSPRSSLFGCASASPMPNADIDTAITSTTVQALIEKAAIADRKSVV